MSTSSYDEPFQLVLSIVAAPAPEGCKGVSYVKWGTEDIGWVRKVAPDDAHQQNPALSVGEWAWWANDGRSALTETGDFIGCGSRLLAAIDLLHYVVHTRGQERDWKKDAGTLAGAVLGLFDRMGKPADLAKLARHAKDVTEGKQEGQ